MEWFLTGREAIRFFDSEAEFGGENCISFCGGVNVRILFSKAGKICLKLNSFFYFER